jgi:hypothetical protein
MIVATSASISVEPACVDQCRFVPVIGATSRADIHRNDVASAARGGRDSPN